MGKQHTISSSKPVGEEPTCWKAGTGRTLIWRRWGDEWVVFDPLSGDTHVLDPLAAEMLKILEGSAVSVPRVIERVAEAFAMPPDERLAARIEELVKTFAQLGLIESIGR